MYLSESIGNYNIKFESVQLNDLEIDTIASIFAALTNAQCKFFLENKE